MEIIKSVLMINRLTQAVQNYMLVIQSKINHLLLFNNFKLLELILLKEPSLMPELKRDDESLVKNLRSTVYTSVSLK